MADSIHANYGRIGFAVVAGTLAIIGTLVYLGGFGGRSDIVYAETYSDNAVTGLSVGSDVNMRGVKIGEGAHVKNCIIMQDGVIEEGAYLENCILDKNVTIPAGEKIIGTRYYPVCVRKGGRLI